MSENNKLILVGLDNDLVDQIKLSKKIKLLGVLDILQKSEMVIGNDENFIETQKCNYLLTLDDPKKKQVIYDKFYSKKKFINFFSTSSYVSNESKFGIGNIVQLGVNIMANVKIGNHCKINIDSSIHHDCILGNFVTIAPGVRLLGNVKIGNNVFIGANSTILPGKKIEDNCIIGACSLINKDIQKNRKVFGVPAK